MKTEIKNLLKLFTFLFCLLPVLSWAATYQVSSRTSTVDGDTFCGGSACTSSDTITIAGGARGNLLIKDFNGNGSYITIENDASTRVIIDDDNSVGQGVVTVQNCKYVDFRGDNLTGTTYGIYINNDDEGGWNRPNIKVQGQSDHIKISYVEMDFQGNTSVGGIGIQVQDTSVSSSHTFNEFEIHHVWIKNSRGHGMYLGHNTPLEANDPWTANFSIHDSIFEDCGGNGFVLKGLSSSGGTNYIYNNKIDNTGIILSNVDEWTAGIRFGTMSVGGTAEIYNNFVTNTRGPGIAVSRVPANIYNNLLCNNGTSNSDNWGHGIVTYWDAYNTQIHDNIIIQPTRYGFYNKNSRTAGVTLSRNLIGDAGLGEWAEAGSGDTIESSSANANIYKTDVALFDFRAWSDDRDYSNDDFTIGASSEKIVAPEKLKIIVE